MTSSDLISGKPKKSLADQIYEQTLEMIVRSPDMVDQVINENRLTELFHVSKAPVREALVRLTSEGVLHSVPRYGYVVERISPIDRKVVVDQRIYLEQKALTISFPNMTDDNLAGIRQQLERHPGRKMWMCGLSGRTISSSIFCWLLLQAAMC